MFDRIIHNPVQTEYVTKTVNVTENRAPTDESVRLLKELEEKALEKFIGRVIVNDNTVNFQLHTFRDHYNCDIKYCLGLKINGKEITKQFSINEWDLQKGKDYIVETIFKNLSEAIAFELLYSMNPVDFGKIL